MRCPTCKGAGFVPDVVVRVRLYGADGDLFDEWHTSAYLPTPGQRIDNPRGSERSFVLVDYNKTNRIYREVAR